MPSPSILAFSTTAANNGSGITGVNAAEQQAPSTVNDGVRGLIARLAFWRDWQAGNITQGGSSNAYTATTGESITAYSNSLRFLWKPNATSSGAVTLNVDGIGAKKVYRPDGTQAGSGDILSGTLLDVVYLSSLDSAAGGFQIVGGIAEATSLSMSAQYRLVGRSSSGAGASEEITSSANVFALLGAANYAAVRGLLDLEAGTDFYSISAANAAFQAASANLTTFAGIAPSANVQSLLAAANYAAARALLDLEAGTDFYSISAANAAFQAASANLTTFAGIAPSANVQSLLAAANYSAMKTLLSLGNVEDKSSATIRGELTSGNVTAALTYTPMNAASYTNVENKSSATIRGEISSGNVTSALGYTPVNPTRFTIDTAAASGGSNDDIWFRYTP